MAATPPATPAMRLIVATIEDYDAPGLMRDLTRRGWRATQIAHTGGALRGGQVSMLIGVRSTQVRQVLRLIDEHCRRSLEPSLPEPGNEDEPWYPPASVAAELGGASVLVLPVVRFERL